MDACIRASRLGLRMSEDEDLPATDTVFGLRQ